MKNKNLSPRLDNLTLNKAIKKVATRWQWLRRRYLKTEYSKDVQRVPGYKEEDYVRARIDRALLFSHFRVSKVREDLIASSPKLKGKI